MSTQTTEQLAAKLTTDKYRQVLFKLQTVVSDLPSIFTGPSTPEYKQSAVTYINDLISQISAMLNTTDSAYALIGTLSNRVKIAIQQYNDIKHKYERDIPGYKQRYEMALSRHKESLLTVSRLFNELETKTVALNNANLRNDAELQAFTNTFSRMHDDIILQSDRAKNCLEELTKLQQVMITGDIDGAVDNNLIWFEDRIAEPKNAIDANLEADITTVLQTLFPETTYTDLKAKTTALLDHVRSSENLNKNLAIVYANYRQLQSLYADCLANSNQITSRPSATESNKCIEAIAKRPELAQILATFGTELDQLNATANSIQNANPLAQRLLRYLVEKNQQPQQAIMPAPTQQENHQNQQAFIRQLQLQNELTKMKLLDAEHQIQEQIVKHRLEMDAQKLEHLAQLQDDVNKSIDICNENIDVNNSELDNIYQLQLDEANAQIEKLRQELIENERKSNEVIANEVQRRVGVLSDQVQDRIQDMTEKSSAQRFEYEQLLRRQISNSDDRHAALLDAQRDAQMHRERVEQLTQELAAAKASKLRDTINDTRSMKRRRIDPTLIRGAVVRASTPTSPSPDSPRTPPPSARRQLDFDVLASQPPNTQPLNTDQQQLTPTTNDTTLSTIESPNSRGDGNDGFSTPLGFDLETGALVTSFPNNDEFESPASFEFIPGDNSITTNLISDQLTYTENNGSPQSMDYESRSIKRTVDRANETVVVRARRRRLSQNEQSDNDDDDEDYNPAIFNRRVRLSSVSANDDTVQETTPPENPNSSGSMDLDIDSGTFSVINRNTGTPY